MRLNHVTTLHGKTIIAGYIKKIFLRYLKTVQNYYQKLEKYLEEENKFTEFHLKDTKKLKSELFSEIKGRIKLDDESLPFKDKHYEYWTKTTEKGELFYKIKKKIGSDKIEEIWNGDFEKEKLKTEYFGVGDLVSWNDRLLAYSLDLRGSEYYTIHVRNIFTNEPVTEKIEEKTSGSILFSLDDKYIFYSKLDKKIIDQEKFLDMN